MKKEKEQYHAPHFVRHGSVDEITRALGDRTITDTIFNADGTIRGQGTGEGDGLYSTDGTVVPCNSNPACV